MQLFQAIQNRALFLSFLLFLFVSPFVLATSLIEPPLADLTQQAVWIGRVRVDQVESVSDRELPFTQLQAEVLEVFKGNAIDQTKIIANIPGGVQGSKTYAIPGLPKFRVGGEYILFLDHDPRVVKQGLEMASAIGLAAWTAYRVTRDESDHRLVTRVGESGVLLQSSRGMALSRNPNAIRDYDGFVGEIFRSIN